MSIYSDVAAAVRRQADVFRVDLPRLLRQIPGQWVVYHDDALRWHGDTQDEGLAWAVRTLGTHAGFMLDRVEIKTPVALSTAGRAMLAVSQPVSARDACLAAVYACSLALGAAEREGLPTERLTQALALLEGV